MPDPIDALAPTLFRRRESTPEVMNPSYDWKARRNDPELLALREEMYRTMAARNGANSNSRNPSYQAPQNGLLNTLFRQSMGGPTTPTFNGSTVPGLSRPSVYNSSKPQSASGLLSNLKGGATTLGIGFGASTLSSYLTRGISNPLVRGVTHLGATGALTWAGTHALTTFAPGFAASLGLGVAPAGTMFAANGAAMAIGTSTVNSSLTIGGAGATTGGFSGFMSSLSSGAKMVGTLIKGLANNPVTIWAAGAIAAGYVAYRVFSHQKDLKNRVVDTGTIEDFNRKHFDKNYAAKPGSNNQDDTLAQLLKNPGNSPQEALGNLQAAITGILVEYFGVRKDGTLASATDPESDKQQKGLVDSFKRKESKTSQADYLIKNLEQMEEKVMAAIQSKFGGRLS